MNMNSKGNSSKMPLKASRVIDKKEIINYYSNNIQKCCYCDKLDKILEYNFMYSSEFLDGKQKFFHLKCMYKHNTELDK